MIRDDLLTALQSIEWNDIEFKEAAWAVPKDALSTVSAFANTEGGHLVFGVKQTNGKFTVTGVIDADQMQNTFLGQVRDTNKVSVLLPIEPKKHDLPEGIVPISAVAVVTIPARATSCCVTFATHRTSVTMPRRWMWMLAVVSIKPLCVGIVRALPPATPAKTPPPMTPPFCGRGVS